MLHNRGLHLQPGPRKPGPGPDPDPGPGRQIFIKIDPGRVRAGKRFSCKPGFIVILAKL